MAVVRTQYGVVSASVTVPDSGARIATVDIPRPADATETNTLDWVKRPAMRKEFECGRCVITADATLAVSGLTLKKVEILALNPGQSLTPIDLSFSQFPDPPVAGATQLLRTVLDAGASDAYTMNLDATKDILKNILVRSGEFVRLTLGNPSGGAGDVTGVVMARYDFGLNAANYGSLPLLI